MSIYPWLFVTKYCLTDKWFEYFCWRKKSQHLHCCSLADWLTLLGLGFRVLFRRFNFGLRWTLNYLWPLELLTTVQPKNNACARTSFCVYKQKFFLRLIGGSLSLSSGNCKNFFAVGCSNRKNFFVVLAVTLWKEGDRVHVSENAKWSERHDRVSAKNIIV